MAIYKVVRALPEAYGFTLDEDVFEAMLSTEELVERALMSMLMGK